MPNKSALRAYIHHGAGTNGPFCTEGVPVKVDALDWQKAGLSYTASGYGSKIPTVFKMLFENRWRRVYGAETMSTEDEAVFYLRAASREKAKAMVRSQYPNARFFR